MKLEDLEITEKLTKEIESISLKDNNQETEFPVVRALEMKRQGTISFSDARIFLYGVDSTRGTKNEHWPDYFRKKESLFNTHHKFHFLIDMQCSGDFKKLGITWPLIRLGDIIEAEYSISDVIPHSIGTHAFEILKQFLLGKYDQYKNKTLGHFYSTARKSSNVESLFRYLPREMATYFSQIIKFDTLWMLTSLFKDNPLILNTEEINLETVCLDSVDQCMNYPLSELIKEESAKTFFLQEENKNLFEGLEEAKILKIILKNSIYNRGGSFVVFADQKIITRVCEYLLRLDFTIVQSIDIQESNEINDTVFTWINNEKTMRTCVWCMKSDVNQTCNNCRKVMYCSKECQRKSWHKGHKALCDQYFTYKHTQEYDVYCKNNNL